MSDDEQDPDKPSVEELQREIDELEQRLDEISEVVDQHDRVLVNAGYIRNESDSFISRRAEELFLATPFVGTLGGVVYSYITGGISLVIENLNKSWTFLLFAYILVFVFYKVSKMEDESANKTIDARKNLRPEESDETVARVGNQPTNALDNDEIGDYESVDPDDVEDGLQ